MDTTPEDARPRWAVLIFSLAIAAIVSFHAFRVWLADYRVHTDQISRMESGVALEPGNGAAWDRLGRVRQADFENPDPVGAVADFQKAVEHDSLSADYWMDLAGAYETTGNLPLALQAFDHAKAVYPSSAQVAWIYGNFLLRHNEYDAGFAQLNRAVLTSPSLIPLAISRTWHSNRDVNVLLDRVLPASADAYFQAIDFMAASGQSAPALVIWQRVLSLGKPVPLPRAFPLIEMLIHADDAEDARRVWREALGAAGLPREDPANDSLIWNGNFASDFANGGLDWRWNSTFGAAIDFDAAPASAGRSVRLDFSGSTNLDLNQPLQFVPVEPARTYHFHANVRTEGISTESGIFFAINDPNHPGAVNGLTGNLTGSHSWMAVDTDITTGPETHFLLVQLRRFQSRMFENKLRGSVWIADVSLTPATAEQPAAK